MEALKIDAKDITAIVDNDLCHSCGACANVCHPEVITFHETVAGHVFPKINYDGCTACELCSAVCPGITFGETMTSILNQAEDPFEGQVLSTWVGQSKDIDILDNGQSGGVASAIILDALENDIIDTAIVAIMSNDGEIHGDVILAYNKEDILRSQQSKYIPIPLLTALSKVKEKKERFAIVGLSCHIHGLHNVLDVKPSLKKKFIFSIGLVCDRVMVNSGMEYLINKVDIKRDDVTEFYFRDKQPHGYPGHIHIKTTTKSLILPPEERMEIKDFFTPARCRICFDKMNIGADITIGDPHGIKNIDRNKGESLVVVRTNVGKSIIDLSVKQYIDLREVDYSIALKGQYISKKKIDWRCYSEEWLNLNKPIPYYSAQIKTKTKTSNSTGYKKSLLMSLILAKFKKKESVVKNLRRYLMKKRIIFYSSFPLKVTKKLIRMVWQ